MSAEPCRVLVLGSGEGTNFEAIAAQAQGRWTIVAAGSDHPSAHIITRARRRAIPVFTVPRSNFPDRNAHDQALARAVGDYAPDLIALAGYMRILGPAMLSSWCGRMLNVHPALLPAFPGLNTHTRAIEAGAAEHGATVHFVTPELDAGPRIVQGRLHVGQHDTPESLRRRVQRLEHHIYPLAIGWYATGRLRMEGDRALLDGRALVKPVLLEEAQCH